MKTFLIVGTLITMIAMMFIGFSKTYSVGSLWMLEGDKQVCVQVKSFDPTGGILATYITMDGNSHVTTNFVTYHSNGKCKRSKKR